MSTYKNKRSEVASAIGRAKNERTEPTAENRRQPWDASDDAFVLGTLELPVLEVAAALGRTYYAIIQRRHTLSLTQ